MPVDQDNVSMETNHVQIDPVNLVKTEENLKKQVFRCKMCIFETRDVALFEKHVADEQHQGDKRVLQG